ncbi:MAG: hypothetical protein J0H48_05330 [Nitrosospira multiformis]|nr:hypothetical protein [Nitrosospira multiformis]
MSASHTKILTLPAPLRRLPRLRGFSLRGQCRQTRRIHLACRRTPRQVTLNPCKDLSSA